MDLDAIDLALLDALQSDARLTAQDLGAKLNLSASQAGRRRQRLEQAGYIRAFTAKLDARKLGLDVQAFVQVEMATHNPDDVKGFARLMRTLPQIVSVWTLTGATDYLLRVYCEDLSALNTLLHERLLPHPAVARVQSQIVMDQLKADAPLPT